MFRKLILLLIPAISFSSYASEADKPMSLYDLLQTTTSSWEKIWSEFSFESKNTLPMMKVESNELPSLLPEGRKEDFKLSLERSLEKCSSQKSYTFPTLGTLSSSQWCTRTIQKFISLVESSSSMDEVFEKSKTEFQWFKSIGDQKGEVMFTGYYSPVLQASLKKSSPYLYPLYKLPKSDSLRRLSRKQIDLDAKLSGKGLEIAYTNDLFENFILQVQGSGKVVIDGKKYFINYAGQNGKPYTSLRRHLLSQGVPEDKLTLQGLREYFSENPEKMVPVLQANQSYVYFKLDPTGPFGAGGSLLTDRHSVAVDRKIFPLHSVVFLHTQRPILSDDQRQVQSWQKFSTFALAQDTGGAIKTPGRVDIYWGEGTYAEWAAGQMKEMGSLYFPVAK